MESHQPEMLPNSSVVAECVKPKPNSIGGNPGDLSKESRVHTKETVVGKQEGSVGVIEVYVHQARDIHNICIYHKQDVYAKICLTSDPETTASTQIVNGGGKNPVFNEIFRLYVQTINSSLKCEIWMLSRVRNYLEDQLLGFALVPLCDVVTGNGNLAQEFSLSSSDLFHSPAGFVELKLTYSGASPDVLEISTPRSSVAVNPANQDPEVPISVPSELNKIEFPDPNIMNENEMMVSEYFEISTNTESLVTTDNGKHLSSEGLSADALGNVEVSKVETPPASVSTTASPSVSIAASSQSASQTPLASKPLSQDGVSSPKEKTDDAAEAESGSSALPDNKFAQPVINVNFEPEQKVVQQEIVDMYMKSMQQFTESLAKMKLPLDNSPSDSGDTTSDERVQAPKSNGRSPRVFYGSRAFF